MAKRGNQFENHFEAAPSKKDKLVEASQQIQQRIQDREKNVELLQQELEAINVSADEAVEQSEKMFTQLIRLMEKRPLDLEQQVRSQQETEVRRVKELQEKLEQEIAELQKLSHTQDHNQFLQDYPSLSALSPSTHSSSINIRPLRYFQDVTAAVSEMTDKLIRVSHEEWTNISRTVTSVDVLLLHPEPKTREEFLEYFCNITLDPNTAYTRLSLSEGDRKARLEGEHQSYPSHPDRFTDHEQVLSRESLTGRCYWEVEWSGKGAMRGVCIAVTYKDIERSRDAYGCVFGRNEKSWVLECYDNWYDYFHNKVSIPVSGLPSSKVGVYLDHSAGILSFYRVSKTMTLLHEVQTTFTQPLYAGLKFFSSVGATAEFCELE